jgi:L-xylulokinase
VKELGALGAAMSAAVATGVYQNYEQAAEAMVRISAPVPPDKGKFSIYQQKYAKYTAICGALDQIWDQFEV